jgi:Uma2 family endonuclease
VTVYRLEQDPEVVEAAEALEGEDVLPGFTLELQTVFRN